MIYFGDLGTLLEWLTNNNFTKCQPNNITIRLQFVKIYVYIY